jgi:hypothetical protein
MNQRLLHKDCCTKIVAQRLLYKDCYTKIDESKIASQRKGLLRRKSFEESYEVSCETSFEVSCETSFEESYEISS